MVQFKADILPGLNGYHRISGFRRHLAKYNGDEIFIKFLSIISILF